MYFNGKGEEDSNISFCIGMFANESYRKDPRVISVMIEVNRRLYMDEATGKKLSCFEEVRSVISNILNGMNDFPFKQVRSG